MAHQPGVQPKKPVALLEREIKGDFRALTKALLDGTIDALKADWLGAVNAWGGGVVEGLGLKAGSPEELAWRVVYTALRQAALALAEENRGFLTREPEDPERLPDELEVALSESEIRIGPDFLSEAWRLPLLRDLQRPFVRWLLAFGVEERRASFIAAQLPQRFGYCLWDEWSCHRDTYAPLAEALAVPVALPPDLDAKRSAYLGYLRDSYRFLDFKGLPGMVEAVEKASGLALSDVYVSIHARTERPAGETWQRDLEQPDADPPAEPAGAAKPADPAALEPLLAQQPALVILGDPGAGKSTLLKHHALGLADDPLAPLPILIPLNQYADALTRQPQSLRSFLPAYFATRRNDLGGLEPLFEQAIANGRAVVLLDGLDEVQAGYGALVQRVEEFVRVVVPAPDAEPLDASIPPGNRVVVTSRFVGYGDAPLADPRWRTCAVDDWDRDGIAGFLERWSYAVELAIAGGRRSPEVEARAAAEQRELLATVFSNPHIERLAGNPLLLTILALIKRQGVTLPDRRVELYELYLETLLDSWRKARCLDRTPIGPEIDFHSAWYVLAALGLWIRETSPQHGLVGERPMRDFLNRYFCEQEGYSPGDAKAEARAFVKSVHTYSSLLVERGPGQYGFLHQTFGEYLAGCGLTEHPEAAEKLREHLFDPGWHETLLLGIGALGIIRKDRRRAGALLAGVLDAQPPPDRPADNVLLAGEALRDLGTVGIHRPVADRITRTLVETLQGAGTEPRKRKAAGLLLGETGWRPEDLDLFVEVPPGAFLYGDDKETREFADRYWIAKYPVTNAQYGAFTQDGGYSTEAWWSGAGWNWAKENGRTEPRYWDKPELNNAIFPVVGISWYEAEAYVNWRQARIARTGFRTAQGRVELPEDSRVHLPSELEWERAARGTDGRKYPWQGEFVITRANAEQGGEYFFTTAVCTYPLGESPAGAWDMAGNVWEWTRSDSGSGRRVVRGGAFYFNAQDVRCASRGHFGPDGRLNIIGFRVVVKDRKSNRS